MFTIEPFIRKACWSQDVTIILGPTGTPSDMGYTIPFVIWTLKDSPSSSILGQTSSILHTQWLLLYLEGSRETPGFVLSRT